MKIGAFYAVSRFEAYRMTRVQPRHFRSVVFLAVGVFSATASFARGQQPGPERRVIAEPRNDLIEVGEVVDHLALPRNERLVRELNALAFGQADAEQTRRRLESRLKSRIGQIDRVCKLTPEQRNKLSVAGRGDIRRVFAQIEELKAQLASRVEFRAPLRAQFVARVARFRESVTEPDCFGDGSLYSKVLKNTLSPQQAVVREKAAKDASIAQHQVTIRWAIGSMEPWLHLSPEQHEKLESLLRARTRPPRKFGAYDYYGLMFQASKLSEEEFKSIFSDTQWQKIEQQIAEARRLEKLLRVGGFLPDDDVADAGSARRNEPLSEPVQPRC